MLLRGDFVRNAIKPREMQAIDCAATERATEEEGTLTRSNE